MSEDRQQNTDPLAEPEPAPPVPSTEGSTTAPPVSAAAPGAGTPAATKGEGKDADPDNVRWQTHLRRWTAAILALVIAVAFIASRYVDDLEVCQTTPPKTQNELAQTVCKPIPVQDVAPLLLIFVALLWPDVTEIDIRGLGRIVRRLDETNETQEEIAETQERIVSQLTQVQQVASQRVDINLSDTTAFAKQVEDLKIELAELQAGQRGEEVQPGVTEPTPSDRASLRGELLDVWRELESWAEFGRRQLDDAFASWAAVMNEGGDLPIPPSSQRLIQRVLAEAGGKIDLDAVRDWYSERQPQIETVRRTLNELDELPDKTLRDALVLAQRALADLRGRGLVDS